MRWKGLTAALALFALLGLFLVTVAAWPADAAGLQMRSSAALSPGVRFMTFVDYAPTSVVNVVEIQAGAPATIRVVPASSSGRGVASVPTLCARVGGVACVNGDMFTSAGPLGGELVNGRWLKLPARGRQQLWVDATGHLSAGAEPAAALQSVGATSYNLVTPGAAVAIPEHDLFAGAAYARTMVGWDGAGNRFLVTVERGRGSSGMSLTRAALLMQALGATTAVNEDGGSSAQMVVRGRWHLAAGEWARSVSNALAVVPA